MTIEVPADFAVSTVAREGPAGTAWIAGLPNTVAALCEQWRLDLDGPPLHGYVALVVPVVRAGTRLVLKISWLDRYSDQEALALRAWNGHGAVRLLEARDDLGAMLLERLDAGRTLEHVHPVDAVVVAGRLLRRLAIPAPPDLRPAGLELAELRASLPQQWEAAGRPFSIRLLERTLELAADRGESHDAVIVNRDLHYGNVLAGDREPWLAIDPKVLAGDLELGVAQLLWSRFDDLRSRSDFDRRFATLVETANLDPDGARRWSTVRIVEYWLWAAGQGFTDDPRKCETLIDWLG